MNELPPTENNMSEKLLNTARNKKTLTRMSITNDLRTDLEVKNKFMKTLFCRNDYYKIPLTIGNSNRIRVYRAKFRKMEIRCVHSRTALASFTCDTPRRVS